MLLPKGFILLSLSFGGCLAHQANELGQLDSKKLRNVILVDFDSSRARLGTIVEFKLNSLQAELTLNWFKGSS